MIALIPAYNPSNQLAGLVSALPEALFSEIVIVDDGSSAEHDAVFCNMEKMKRVTVLKHKVNLGKGAALKTGLNHIRQFYPNHIGVVTLDADGQHLPEDVLAVGNILESHNDSLVVGVRAFDRYVPMRSRFGNWIMKYLFRLLAGQRLADTQSGLRGIPLDFIPHLLEIKSNGYEFELDMLLACKHSGREIIERGIQTVYCEGNKSSHFKPMLDSMKICAVLFRFLGICLLATVIDCSIFGLVASLNGGIAASQVAGRIAAMIFAYFGLAKTTGCCDKKVSHLLPKYALFVFVGGLLSYEMIHFLSVNTSMNAMGSKLLTEAILFPGVFVILRDFIFTQRERSVDGFFLL